MTAGSVVVVRPPIVDDDIIASSLVGISGICIGGRRQRRVPHWGVARAVKANDATVTA